MFIKLTLLLVQSISLAFHQLEAEQHKVYQSSIICKQYCEGTKISLKSRLQVFIASNMFVAATVLGPMMYQMWIYNGSANSNYFFAINLVFGVAQILLVTDLLFAQIKRDFYLKNGFKDLQPSQDDPAKGTTKRLAFK